MTVSRTPVHFESGGLTLRGTLYRPAGAGPFAAVVLTHGFAFVAQFFQHHDYPARLADEGFVTLVYDHPHTGRSDGSPRQELDPIAQQRAYSDAVTFLTTVDGVDPNRIGVWGTSYSGGHVLAVAANDRRIACVVSQTPTINGRRNLERRLTVDQLHSQRQAWAADRLARCRGERPRTAKAGSAAADDFVARLPSSAVGEYQPIATLRSDEWYSSYEPGLTVRDISPIPMLMIVCTRDRVTPPEDALHAFNRASEPKKLLLLDGDHFDVYEHLFEPCAQAAVDWFSHQLPADGRYILGG